MLRTEPSDTRRQVAAPAGRCNRHRPSVAIDERRTGCPNSGEIGTRACTRGGYRVRGRAGGGVSRRLGRRRRPGGAAFSAISKCAGLKRAKSRSERSCSRKAAASSSLRNSGTFRFMKCNLLGTRVAGRRIYCEAEAPCQGSMIPVSQNSKSLVLRVATLAPREQAVASVMRGP